ncbi:MAG: DNA-3-methyladenine glycosylase [Acidimicrobiia bacterium]|nr:DNA-3-methyladenine glycosylase [Acidimicrobiia bacterium]
MTAGNPLEREFYARDALDVAPQLLHKVLAVGDCAGRIVEVEAYRADDPASHSFRGRTPRNAAMFGPAGVLYVYFTYGMHHCANVVTGAAGDGQAVLLRAVVPLAGVELMRERRGRRDDRSLADGPGKLCQAFGLDRTDDGTDLCAHPTTMILDDRTPPPPDPVTTPRIGIRHATDRPWRWLAD